MLAGILGAYQIEDRDIQVATDQHPLGSRVFEGLRCLYFFLVSSTTNVVLLAVALNYYSTMAS